MRARHERFSSAPPARPRDRRSHVGWCVLCFVIEAQAQADAPSAVVLEKVVVTGSNIARVEGESGLPVQVITRDEMPQGGVQTMQDLLDRISANQSFGGSNPAWRGPPTAVGRVTLALNGTYVLDYAQGGYESDGVPSVGTRSPLGVGAIARYGQYAQLNWTYGPWGATLANNYQSGSSEPCREEDPTGCITRRVGSYSVRDLQGRYTGLHNTTRTPGVRNALDRAPPLTNQGDGFQKGLDPSYADPRGRMFYGALNYAFQ